MIGTIDIKVNAAHPNMPLSPVYTFLGSPQQVRIINVPKQIGNWKITAIQVTVNYPDNSSPSVEATLVGGCWSATLPAPSAVGQSLMGFKVTASGVDEHGDPITGYVLGKGDTYVLDDDATITVGSTTYYVHIVDAPPATPRKGDLAVIDNIYQLYDGSRWHPLGNQATISWANITGKPDTFPPEAHTHTKSEITDFPTEMPPTAHSHASDNWFTSALSDKLAKTAGTATDLTVIEPLTIQASTGGKYAMFSVGTVDGVLYISGASDLNVESSGRTLNQINDKLNELDDGKANASDFSLTNPAPYVAALFDARLPYPLYAVPSTGLLKDRAINTTSLASVTVPDDFTDLLVRASVTTSLPVTMPSAITTKYGDTFPAAAGEYLITITKTGAAEAYVRVIKLEVAQ